MLKHAIVPCLLCARRLVKGASYDVLLCCTVAFLVKSLAPLTYREKILPQLKPNSCDRLGCCTTPTDSLLLRITISLNQGVLASAAAARYLLAKAATPQNSVRLPSFYLCYNMLTSPAAGCRILEEWVGHPGPPRTQYSFQAGRETGPSC